MEQTECGTGIKEVSESNPGIWVDHSGYVAEACKNIAQLCHGLSVEEAYMLL